MQNYWRRWLADEPRQVTEGQPLMMKGSFLKNV